MTEELNNLIRKTERQQKQLQLSQQFTKNMQFLSSLAPELYEEYKNFSPTHLKLTMRDNGELDLVALKTGQLVYKTSTEELHQKAVDDFFKNPKCYYTTYEPIKKQLTQQEPYIVHSNAAIEELNRKIPKPNKVFAAKSPKLMVIAGVGIGYHLPKILGQADIKNLFIIEPDKDLFFASLHTLNWEDVAEYFAREGYSLNLQIGQTPETAIEALQEHVQRIGPHNSTATYLFDLLQTKKVSESTQFFLKKLTQSLTALGYFDDERVGLAHTINNIKSGIPALIRHSSISKKKEPEAAFVIGNGPSLDKAEHFLKENRDRAIIISCGTTLGSLESMGISPDFHVEQERPRLIREWLEASTSAEFRRSICLVGLNTVHPEVYDLFDQKAMYMKPNDLGSTYSQKLLKSGKQIIQLPNCNPTVTNAGASLAVALGFSDIYFIGVDYGSPSAETHHSKHSAYYRFKKQYSEQTDPTKTQSLVNDIEGNFGGKVQSTKVLNLSRLSLETLIEKYPDFNYYNTSDGAKINGSLPIRYSNISLPERPLDKENLVHRLIEDNFSADPFGFDRERLIKEAKADFKPAGKTITAIISMLDREITTEEQASTLVDKVQSYLNQLPRQSVSEKAIYTLLKGTISMFNMLLQSALSKGAGTVHAVEVFNYIANEYKQYLYKALDQLRNGFLENDLRKTNVADAME